MQILSHLAWERLNKLSVSSYIGLEDIIQNMTWAKRVCGGWRHGPGFDVAFSDDETIEAVEL